MHSLQVFNEVNAREMEKFNVFRHTFNNKIFLFILGFTIVFQVIMVQFLGKFANTVPLNKEQWLITVFIGFMSLPIAAIVKLIPVPKKKRVSHETQPLLANGHDLNLDVDDVEDRVQQTTCCSCLSCTRWPGFS
jgi:cytochrome c biogenesis protein CcdA